MIREDITIDEFIDVLIGTRKYLPCLCAYHSTPHIYHVLNSALPLLDVYNKIDSISLETMDRLAREDHTAVISCEMDLKYDLFPYPSREGMVTLMGFIV